MTCIGCKLMVKIGHGHSSENLDHESISFSKTLFFSAELMKYFEIDSLIDTTIRQSILGVIKDN